MGLHEDLIAAAAGHWPLQDDAASTSIVGGGTLFGGSDSAGLSNDNGPGFGYPKSLALDGSHYIETTTDLDWGDPCTLSAWVRLDASPPRCSLWGAPSDFCMRYVPWAAGWSWCFGAFNTNQNAWREDKPWGTAVPPSAWAYMSAVHDGDSNLTVYANGSLASSKTLTATLGGPTGPLVIGARANNASTRSEPFVGEIAGLTAHASALTLAQHAALTNGPLPAHTGGTVALSSDLGTVTDTTTFAASTLNGTVTKTLSYQHLIASQWEETDTNTFANPVVDRSYRVVVSATNGGGNDPTEDQVSNVVTHSAVVPRVARRASRSPVLRRSPSAIRPGARVIR